MAIKYLSSIDLRTNELQYAVIQPLTTAPTGLTAALGQVYFNTADDKLKIYTSTGWATVGGVNSVTSGNANTITIGGTAGNPTISANTAAVSSGSLNLVTGDAVYDFVTGLGYVESVSSGNSTFISTAITGTAADPIVTASLSATGTPDNTKYLRGDNTWAVISPATITLTGDVTGSGTASIATTIAAGAVEFAMIDSAVIVTSSEGIENNNNNITIPTSAAVKAYADSLIVGGLIYQGGYNAATNTPDLTTSPNSIKKGWTYTVTADGTFFTEQLRVGDVLIAESDNPSTLANWTTVQNNVDLASLTQVGIGNVNAGTGIDVTYSSGTATVTNTDPGSSQNIFKNIAVSGQTTVVADTNNDTLTLVAGTDITITTDAATDTITIASAYTPATTAYATTISDTATVTHSLGTKDVMVQLYDTVTFDTVYADVTRPTVNTVTITFASTPVNPIRVLVQK